LAAGDVRLTMGGEPTFIAVDDLDAPEWNTAALGPTKRVLATDLFGRLKERYAKDGALVHFGQGQGYPGEPLPRWTVKPSWRRDGEPLWRDVKLIANENENEKSDEKKNTKTATASNNADDAKKLLEGVATRLGLHTKNVFAGYEDVYYYLWRERRLPINV